jgi:hypothetical protein
MLYRKTYTKLMPPGADLFTRKGEHFARYTDRKGRTKTAKVTTNEHGIDRLTFTSPVLAAALSRWLRHRA